MSCFLHSRIWAILRWEKAWCLWKPWSSTSGVQYELVWDRLLNSQIPKISRYGGKWAWLLLFFHCSSLSSCLAWFNLTVRVSHGFGWDPDGSVESHVWILAFFTAQQCPWNTNPLCRPSAHTQPAPMVSLGQCRACASQSKATKLQSVLLVVVEGIEGFF